MPCPQRVLLLLMFATLAANAYPEFNDDVVLLQASQRVNHGARLKQVSRDPQIVSTDYSVVLRGAAHSVSLHEAVNVDNTNMVLIRTMKTASSTASGITRRIGAHHGLHGVFNSTAWITEYGEPGVFCEHSALDADDFGPDPENEPVYMKTNETIIAGCTSKECRKELATPVAKNLWKNGIQALELPTFLWTFVRDPAARVMSLYYFSRENLGLEITTQRKIDYLHSYTDTRDNSNFIFRYLRSSAEDTIEDLFKIYGLVSVVERFDESVVVLAATLKIPLSDVLYISSKDSSKSFFDKDFNVTHSSHPSISEEPDEVQDYINNEFKQNNDLDYELLQRANDVLDARIAEMNLEPAIKMFTKFLADVHADCGEECSSSTGYVNDQGCNYECLDKYNTIGREMCTWCD